MIYQPLVSIIIPTYNRADLIGETLDSIIAQTYLNWECIVVDDGSEENNVQILKDYESKDSRFIILERKHFKKIKGANSCRNIGKDLSLGDYIIFFDSDDIMYPNHIETKVNAILLSGADMVIFTSEYFNNPQNINPINYRGLFEKDINVDNYITQQVNWITFDAIIESVIAKSVDFNQELQANQEYNYFSKLLFYVDKVQANNIILTKRRFDTRSIQGSLSLDNSYNDKAFKSFLTTYIEINKKATSISKKFLLMKIIELGYRNKKLFINNKTFLYKHIIKEFGIIKGLNKIRLIEFKK